MMTNTSTKKTRKTNTIGNRALMKRAHAIRKTLARQHGVNPRFISWSSCIKVAQGRKAQVTDCWGNYLTEKWSAINKALLSWDCPVVIDYELVARLSDRTVKEVYDQIRWLAKKGVIADCHGWESISADARPYWEDQAHVICL